MESKLEGGVVLLYPLAISVINWFKGLRSPEERRQGNRLISKVVSNPRCIVVTRLQNIGDMVAFIPSLLKLRELYPEAEILLMGKHKAGIETIKGAPFIDDIVEVGQGTLKEKLRLFRKLRKRGVDIFIVSSQDQGRVPWALLSGSKVIVAFDKVRQYNGVRKEKLRFLISIKANYDPDNSDAENNLRLVGALGIDVSYAGTCFEWVDEKERKRIEKELYEVISEDDKKLIVFSPGTKRPSRAWPAENFTKLAARLNERYGAKIVLVGGRETKQLNEQICAGHKFIVDFSGKTSIPGLGYLLSKADLVISVDSGPMHIAAAVGTPTVALFGPGDYKVWKPYCKDPHSLIALRVPTTCAPCLNYECVRKTHECMKGISVEAVVSEVDRLMRTKEKA